MKLTALLLGAAMPFAAIAGAQAADLAVASAAGAACGGGGIPSGSVCITIAGRVREDIHITPSPVTLTTTGHMSITGSNDTAGATLVLQIQSAPGGNGEWRIDNGTIGWVNMGGATLKFGFDALPGPGGGFTDNGARHPDTGGVDFVGAWFGSAWKIGAAVGNTDNTYGGTGWQGIVQAAGSMGGLATTLAAGFVNEVTNGWAVNGSVGGALGAAAWKVWAAWGNNARGFVTNRAPNPGNATGTDWVVGGGVKLPLGSAVTVAVDASVENLSGAGTSTLIVGDLIFNLAPNALFLLEGSKETGGAFTAFARLQANFNGG